MPPNQIPSDTEILGRAKRDPDCFGILYQRHGAAVLRFLARRVDAGSAEDLLAEVFTAAFSARLRVTPHDSGSALPWLYGIAGNVVRSHRRKVVGIATGKPYAANPDESSSTLDWDAIDARIDAGAKRTALRAALNALSPGERELLLLVAWEGLTPAEAGLALGLSPEAARSRLHRARKRSQSVLDTFERASR